MKKFIGSALSVLTLAATAAVAQTSSSTPPPIKMGLWRNTVTASMTGVQIPPDVAARLKAMGRSLPTGEPHTSITESCLTPEKWREMLNHMQPNEDCKESNQHQDSSGMSTDLACKSSDGRTHSTGHIEASFASAEKVRGKAHMEMVMPSQPQPIVMDMHFESVYQGSDCQGISPDEPKVVH